MSGTQGYSHENPTDLATFLQPVSLMRDVSNPGEVPASEPNNSMQEYHQLQWELLVTTIVLTSIFFLFVWYFYSLNIALNYLLGACTGVVYLKVLARNVEQLGAERQKLGKSQIVIFIGLILVATQWKQLQILPVFLGFLTYKATILVYTLRILMPTDSR